MSVQTGIRVALLLGLWLCVQPGSVDAGGRLPALSYRGGGYGKVIFDHQLHASLGFRCNDCHTDFAGTGKILFTTRKQGLIDFKDHTTGAKCFACHNANVETVRGGFGLPDDGKGPFYNGKGAFDDCAGCHRKIGGF
ncbi:MAG: cytochrome c3 family protein [Bryobacteraceae bacterium]